MNNFFRELKRRNVYKVAVAYAVVSWLLIQVATSTFPVLEIPNWATKLVIAFVVLGFPLALIFAWAFELTPEGIKRTEDVAADESITRRTGRKLMAGVAVVAALAVGLFLSQLFRSNRDTGRVSSVPSSATDTAGQTIPAKSIAVLPFQNLSKDEENAFFADGVQDEILTRLAQVGDLKVISRTSTQRFKNAPVDLPSIAKQLGVRHVLEGSVQKSADRVRVNVQLINAPTEAHLWAETYDRKLTDIFAVESDIAKRIADTLHAKLSGAEAQAIAKRPTANPEAHELYLKGRFFWNKRTGTDLLRAVEQFQAAISKDPTYALAYAGLADAYVLLPGYSAASPAESLPQAKAAALKALEIDPTLAEAHTSLAMTLYAYDLDFAGSADAFEKAIALNPNYATAHHWYSNTTLATLEQWDRMLQIAKRALELDPLSLIIHTDYAVAFINVRRYDEAIAELRKALQLDPRFAYAHLVLGQALQFAGDLEGAIVEYTVAAELVPDDSSIAAYLAQAHARAGQTEQARRALTHLTESAKKRYVSRYSFAILHLGLGDKATATEHLERAFDERAGTDLGWLHVEPLFDELRGYPPFDALVRKVIAWKQ